MKNILIDCDPGHDDALAVLTALANPEELNILGITTVGGNQMLEKVTQNAKNILCFAGAKVPLAKGQKEPLVKPLSTGEEAHGESGMDGPCFDRMDYPVESENAVQFLYEKIMKCEERVTLVALAPLTNLALLIKVYPEVKKKIECVSMMGGGVRHGNCTELAEFNIYVDPEAAYIVFRSGIPIVMSGLDVTEKAFITIKEIETLQSKGRISQMVYELLSFYNKSGRQFGFVDSPLHDLCAVVYLLKPEIFTGSYRHVNVVTDNGVARGLTFADLRIRPENEANALVLDNLNRERFIEILVRSLERLDNEVRL